MASWTLDLNEWAKKQQGEIIDVKRTLAMMVFVKIVQRTPVDTGAHRQNWLVTLNGENFGYNPGAKKGGRVMSDGQRVIMASKPADRIILQNNGPAIGKLEYGGYGSKSKSGKTVNGFSKQAPRGMVGITMAEAGAILNQAIGEVKS